MIDKIKIPIMPMTEIWLYGRVNSNSWNNKEISQRRIVMMPKRTSSQHSTGLQRMHQRANKSLKMLILSSSCRWKISISSFSRRFRKEPKLK